MELKAAAGLFFTGSPEVIQKNMMDLLGQRTRYQQLDRTSDGTNSSNCRRIAHHPEFLEQNTEWFFLDTTALNTARGYIGLELKQRWFTRWKRPGPTPQTQVKVGSSSWTLVQI